MLALGIKEVPTTVIGARHVTGYRPRELAQLLGVPLVTSGARTQQQLLDSLFAVLGVAQCYCLAAPDSAIAWVSATPGHRMSDMPLGIFAYHIFRLADLTLETVSETGRMRPELDHLFKREGAAIATSRALSDYTAAVLEKLRLWAESPIDWSKQVDGNVFGPCTVEALWRIVTNHSGHHLRQFQVYLKEAGIPVPEPLPAELDRLELPASLWG